MRAVFILLLLFHILPVPAGSEVIKLGTLAPEGSPWEKALRRIAVEWNAASDGRISVKVYAGGIAGDEPNMLRKIKINQLQAAAITGVGMGSIAEGVYSIQLPLLIRTSEEFDYVIGRMEPTLNGLIEEKGFVVLAWFLAGWAHFFSKTPAVAPDEMKRLKLQVDYSAPAINKAWKEMGFRVVPIASTDVLPALQSGLVEAFLLTPLTAAAMQWFGVAKNMMDLRVAPMVSGLIVSQRAWSRIPDEMKPELLAVVQRNIGMLRSETESLEEQALSLMLENGLQVLPVSPQVEAEWRQVVQEGLEIVVGNGIPAEPVEQVRMHLVRFRAR